MELQEPLLADGSYSATTTATFPATTMPPPWPALEASRAKLFVPRHWPGGQRDDATCVLTYDADSHLFHIVAHNHAEQQEEERGVVLDTMDPRDVIGANLEIKLFANMDRDDSMAALFRNAAVEESQEQPDNEPQSQQKASSCDIFSPLANDMEKIFSTSASNNNNDNHSGDDNDDSAPHIPYDTQATAFLNIYCYPRRDPKNESWLAWCGLTASKNPTSLAVDEDYWKRKLPPSPNPPTGDGHRYPHHRRLEVVPSQDFADVRILAQAIRRVASNNPSTTGTTSAAAATPSTSTATPRKVLILVNPKAGTNNMATHVYENIAMPMLEQACIEHDVYTTTSTSDAEHYMARKPDLVQSYSAYICMGGDGVLHETIQGIRKREDSEQVRKKLVLGVVGCGTGNGLAKSILHASEEQYSPLESMFVICKGESCSMDLSTYYVADKKYTSFLTFTWAMIAEVDLESEYIRCLGASRFDIWAVWRTLNLRRYRAKLSYLPPTKDTRTKGIGTLPPLSEPVPSDWVTIEDDFILFWASHVTHAAVGTYHCPPSKIQDGVLHILVIRGPASRYKIAGLLLGLEYGTHVDSSIAEFIECVAYRLEPITEGSFNDLDGEEIESGPIQAKVEPAAMQVFCTPLASP